MGLSKKNIESLQEIMIDCYGNIGCALNFKSPFELLVSTILAAQCTDVRVNVVTGEMFKKYNKPQDFAFMEQEKLEGLIKSCGFYRNKASAIISSSRAILDEYGGQVPDSLEKLVALPGVGRKTASVVLANGFCIPAFAVDTHVFRVTGRIGIAHEKTADKQSEALEKIFDKSKWIILHHCFIWHGRKVCSSQRPNCADCAVNELCKHYSVIFKRQ